MSLNTSAADDILRPLNDEEFAELLELYKEKYDTNGFQYLLLHLHYIWNEHLTELAAEVKSNQWILFRKTFYTHRNGDFRRFGTYVCLYGSLVKGLVQHVAFHTWETDCNELLDCLRKTSLIHWENRLLLISVANDYSESVKEIALAKGVKLTPHQYQGFVLQMDQALKLQIPRLPEGYGVAHIYQQHADLIYSLWANQKQNPLNYIKALIQLGRCMGVMDESTNELVAWICQNEFTSLGILEVLPSAEGSGLALYLAIAMSKFTAKIFKIPPTAFVVVGDEVSESFLRAIGFQGTVIYDWIQLEKNED